ncbi:MAG: Alkanesulfonates transport system permease protein [Frankiales bacterium]|jgi:NitT/TauT family transport system permease protein|nr:Alkanesulfonates transport system permease protein [Frankiales bacterium]
MADGQTLVTVTEPRQDMEQTTGARAASSAGTRTRRAVRLPRAWGFPALAATVLLVVWQLASMRFPDYLLPGVGETLSATWHLVLDFPDEIGLTLLRLLGSIAIAMFGGWAIGLFMSIRHLGPIVEPFLKIASAIPFVSWVLLAVLWVANIEVRILFVVVVLVLPVYAVNVYEGVRTFDPELVQAVRQFGPGRWQFARYVLIPNSVADVILTTKSMTGFSLRITVFAELVGASTGVGALMADAQSNFRVDQLLGLTLVMIASTLVLLALVGQAERRLLRWRPESAVG